MNGLTKGALAERLGRSVPWLNVFLARHQAEIGAPTKIGPSQYFTSEQVQRAVEIAEHEKGHPVSA